MNKVSAIRIWIKNNKKEFLVLAIILVVAAFVRLYKIDGYMTFLGDEGRDVIIVRRFLTQGDIMLIGPGTSIGNMYLGPLYYYMMAPALLAFMYSPVGPAVMIALMGIATVWFVWYLGRLWFGSKAGAMAAALYAIAPTIIIYSRSSWNPNIMPFFAILGVFSIWKVWVDKKFPWLIVTGISFAACLQSHYLAFLLVPPLGLFWLLSLINNWKTKNRKQFILHSILMFAVFLLLMSPLAIFDIRHNFINFNALKAFFTERQTTVSIKPWKAIPDLLPQFSFITDRLVTGYDAQIAKWASLVALASALLVFKRSKLKFSDKKARAMLVVVTWIGAGLVGLSLYKQQIYDHYYGFLFPVFFILAGATLSLIWESKRFIGTWVSLTLFIFLVWVNLKASPLQYPPNMQYPRSIAVANYIMEKAGVDKFNFAVIAERNYEGAYQYFLEKEPNFRVIDPQNTKETITEQLYVVCEMQESKCDPTHNAKTEIAAFGWSKVTEKWEVSGVIVYKLTHNYPTDQKTQQKK